MSQLRDGLSRGAAASPVRILRPPAFATAPPTVSDDPVPALDARVVALENGRAGARPKTVSTQLTRAHAVVRDRGAAPMDRARALAVLRAEDDRPAAVVAEMMELLRSPTTDPPARAEIVRHLAGVEDPQLGPLLRELLTTAPEEVVRFEALQALAGHQLGDPLVQAALERARNDDPSDRIRREIASQLAAVRARPPAAVPR